MRFGDHGFFRMSLGVWIYRRKFESKGSFFVWLCY